LYDAKYGLYSDQELSHVLGISIGVSSMHETQVGGVVQWLGRRSLAGELYLIYA